MSGLKWCSSCRAFRAVSTKRKKAKCLACGKKVKA